MSSVLINYQSICCRLCINISNDHRCLYDETGKTNEIYELMTKYFNPAMLNMDLDKDLRNICEECWHHLEEFQNFQDCVIEAQKINTNSLGKLMKRNLDDREEIVKLENDSSNVWASSGSGDHFHIEVKSENNASPSKHFEIISVNEDMDLNSQKSTIKKEPEANEEYEDNEDYKDQSNNVYDNSLGAADEDVAVNTKIDVPNKQISGKSLNSTDFIDQEISDAVVLNRRKPKDLNLPTTNEESDRLIAEWKSSLACDLCGKSLASFSLLQKHFLHDHPNEECHILCCKRKFFHRYDIEKHVRFHQAPPELRCDECCEFYSRSYNARRHKQEKHSGKPKSADPQYPCKECGKTYKGSYFLQRHIDFVHGEKKDKAYRCRICDKDFICVSNLRYHLMTKHETEPNEYICSVCSQGFHTNPELKDHYKKQHFGEENRDDKSPTVYGNSMEQQKEEENVEKEIGSFDQRSTNSPNLLKESLHSPKSCDADQESTTFMSHEVKSETPLDLGEDLEYETHNNIEEMEEASDDESQFSTLPRRGPFQPKTQEQFYKFMAQWKFRLECDICHQLLSSYSQLEEHFNHCHPSEECYIQCCQRKLQRRYDIVEHVHYHKAPQKLKCTLCFRPFRSVACARDHKSKHHNTKKPKSNITSQRTASNPSHTEGHLQCEMCKKFYKTMESLRAHQHKMHSGRPLKPYKCEICDKTFATNMRLQEHMAIHTGETMHKCSYCPMTFTYSSGLYMHMRKKHGEEYEKRQKEKKMKGNGPFKCAFCSKIFRTYRSVWTHTKQIHKSSIIHNEEQHSSSEPTREANESNIKTEIEDSQDEDMLESRDDQVLVKTEKQCAEEEILDY
ncbi:uncharacterized protein LOC142229274 isoform X1 [Haematobia irritans]|uniref:uncharacterized protein LOC142229274 isoform X1 n=1 Tax=Haematobia irritans TaxID=7368 RepID=UPI003F507EDC